MKNIIIFTILTFCLSCKKEDPYPNAKTAKGSIEATANRKIWPESNETVQVLSVTPLQEYLTKFPCAKEVLNVSIASFSNPDGFLRTSYYFNLPLKVGNYSPTYTLENRESICIGLPFSSILAFGTSDGDVLETGYDIDTTENNIIVISSITNNKVVGSFDLHFVRSIGFGSTQYPENNVHLVCKQFIADR